VRIGPPLSARGPSRGSAPKRLSFWTTMTAGELWTSEYDADNVAGLASSYVAPSLPATIEWK